MLRFILLAPMSVMLLASVSPAASSGEIEVELNNAIQKEQTCRLSFLVRNGLEMTIGDLGVEVVLLDDAGLARDFMTLRTGRLPSGKRRVRQFDLPDVACAELGEILINDVADCQAEKEGESLSPDRCLEALRVQSRIAIGLGL
ncbi:hypothetical protein [uncultured Cohaesibacter sp.]|uniref:hypothetical protein n=1 Tax=uncultured Cohaesibacter sp. TaxID=1002546 RepID=UPI0029C7ED86|nr:hypothetical protein [uncultured Cohaesibacter sp.]